MRRFALIDPLRERDFRLLWTGMTVSMLGDGIMLVAAAWLVYDLSSSPSALSLVGVAFSTGHIACLLLGGVVADRVDRRLLMIVADLGRGLAVAGIGTLALTGVAEVWMIAALAFGYGCAEGFFNPAFQALLPQVVAPEHRVQANALHEVVSRLALRLAGPAVGGGVVAAVGPGTAYLVDAGTFAVGIACVAAIRPRPPAPRQQRPQLRAELAEGLRFVRAHAWLWATLLSAAISVLAFVGPVEVLLPYLVRHDLGGSAGAFGVVLAAGGVGSVLTALAMAQTGLPARALRLMYVTWGFGVFPVAGYAVATAIWQLAALSLLFGAGMTAGTVVWATLMQSRVPVELMGRVTSLDWMVSFALTPLSFGLAGPLADWFGAEAVLVVAGLVGGATTLVIYLAVPRLRSDVYEPGDVLGEPGVADVGGLHPDDLDAVPRR